ncbi:MAG: phosphoribosylanthranilate isomerase [Pyrinomonadaceae bacterium]|nr:phosphoribosylanthranilate isomerase [Sphingobacteriaceae bacterium]
MREAENISNLAELQPDYIGFIFYQNSPRFVENLDFTLIHSLKVSIKKTGVFVNASAEYIQENIAKYNLNAIQLHGDESPEFCLRFKSKTVEVIKAFGIGNEFKFNDLNLYFECVDYFLFDTKSSLHGGSGKIFDWQLLESYKLPTPYFLSGGLSEENINELQDLKDSRLYALDLNSRFETSPGFKDIKKLRSFFNKIKNPAPAEKKRV